MPLVPPPRASHLDLYLVHILLHLLLGLSSLPTPRPLAFLFHLHLQFHFLHARRLVPVPLLCLRHFLFLWRPQQFIVSPSSSDPQQRRCRPLSFTHLRHLSIYPLGSPLPVHGFFASSTLCPSPNFTRSSPYLPLAHFVQVLLLRPHSCVPHDQLRPPQLLGPRHIPFRAPFAHLVRRCLPACPVHRAECPI